MVISGWPSPIVLTCDVWMELYVEVIVSQPSTDEDDLYLMTTCVHYLNYMACAKLSTETYVRERVRWGGEMEDVFSSRVCYIDRKSVV